jgi:hypothetical protein
MSVKIVVILQVGDRILRVNGIETDGLRHEQVVQLLKSSGDIIIEVTQGRGHHSRGHYSRGHHSRGHHSRGRHSRGHHSIGHARYGSS